MPEESARRIVALCIGGMESGAFAGLAFHAALDRPKCAGLLASLTEIRTPFDLYLEEGERSMESGERNQRSSGRVLRTVPQVCEAHPAFTSGGIRWLLFNRDINGLECAVVKVGRRVLIDEDRFFTWLDEQNKADKR